MIIIIDAYNLIKHIVGASFVSDREIAYWVDFSQKYTIKRHNDVVMVFDAGPGYYKTVEQKGRLTLIYSGQADSADDVIKDWLSSRRGQDILLVTSDREICDFAHRLDVVSIGSRDFHRIFSAIMAQQESHDDKVSKQIHKTTDVVSQELDALMESGSRILLNDSLDQEEAVHLRVRNGKKASKKNKRLDKKIEKM